MNTLVPVEHRLSALLPNFPGAPVGVEDGNVHWPFVALARVRLFTTIHPAPRL